MREAARFPFLAGVMCILAVSASVGDIEGRTSERRTRLGVLVPRSEPSPDAFSLEVDAAPYAVLDASVAKSPAQVPDTQIAVHDDLLLVAYSDGGTNRLAKLWIDDGAGGGTAGDALANGSEIRVVDALPAFDATAIAAISVYVVGGRIAMTYAGDADDSLKLWYDDGAGGGVADDAQVQAGERRTLTTDFLNGGEILATPGGQLIVLWKDSTALRLWVDDGENAGVPGDGVINGAEVRVLNVPPDARIGNGRTFTNFGGPLAVTYWWGGVPPNFSSLYVFVDDGAGAGNPGDYVIGGSELRFINTFNAPPDRWNTVAWVNGLLSVSFHLSGADQDQWLWYDDGGTSGDGIAGDLEFSDSEQRKLLELGDVGHFSSIVEVGGRLAVPSHYVIPPQLKLFYDDGNDGAVADDHAALGGVPGIKDPPEARIIDQPLGGGGFGASATVFDPDPLEPAVCDHLVVAHVNECDTCGYPNGYGLHLTTANLLAPRGLFVHDTGNHQFHDPLATNPNVDLTLRWFQDGSDEGEVLITGDVTGPNAGVWLPLLENIIAWPDFMTVPVTLTGGNGDKTVFMEFRNGACAGNITVRTITLGIFISDPTNLTLSPGAPGEASLDWNDVLDPGLDGYNVYRASNLDQPGAGQPPTSWTLLNGALLPISSYVDASAPLGGGVELLYYYVTAVDTLGNESSDPPN